MIAGLSKAIHRYLAPLLLLTSLFLILFVYLSPVVMFHTQVSLVTVTPSSTPTTAQGVDGPSLFLGALGSCERSKNNAAVTCSTSSVSPKYDLSDLPSNSPGFVFEPSIVTPVFIAVALAFTGIFFLLFASTAVLNGRLHGYFDKSWILRSTAWIGLLGFVIGLLSFLVLRLWFGKAVEDFNAGISAGGKSSPELVAATSNGFVLIYVAYAFYATVLVFSLAKVHLGAPGKSDAPSALPMAGPPPLGLP